MAAPTASVRTAPLGFMLEDGYSTKVSSTLDPNIAFWEKTVQPPGLDGGEAIPQTTMHNIRYRTTAPRSLMTLTPITIVAAYDPAVYDQIHVLINENTSWTVTFPDTSTYTFFGFLQSFIPEPNEEGVQPEATIIITPTNYDPENCVEADPVLDANGTC